MLKQELDKWPETNYLEKRKNTENGSSELYCSNVFKSDQLVDRLNLDDLGLYECCNVDGSKCVRKGS